MGKRNLGVEFVAFLIVIAFFIVFVSISTNTESTQKTGAAVAMAVYDSLPENYGGYISPQLNAITAGIVSDDSIGEAPFTVHVSAFPTTALGELRAYENLEYSWDFGDINSANTFTNPVTGEIVNSNSDQTGPEAAHIYYEPGTYTITLTVRGWTGLQYITDTTTLTVTVSSWSGEDKYFDPVNGDDNNDGSQASPWKTYSKLNSWIRGGDNRAAFIKKGTTFEIDGAITFYGNNKRLMSYGSGNNPVVKPSSSYTGSLVNFWANGGPVIDMLIKDIDFFNDGKHLTALSLYSKPETEYSPTSEGDAQNIAIINSHVNIDSSGEPAVFTGTGPMQRISFWNVFFDHGTATGRQGLYISAKKFIAVMGGKFEGGDGSGILDHHIYPSGYNMLFRWIDFQPFISKNFCINGNTGSPGYKYWLIADNYCSGANGFDMSNANNNINYVFNDFIIQGNAISDLGRNGQGSGIFGYSVDRYTIRDNFIYDIPRGALAMTASGHHGLIYRNKFFMPQGYIYSIPGNSNGEFKYNEMVFPTASAGVLGYDVSKSGWDIDYNTYWFPQLSKPFTDSVDQSKHTFEEWQSFGFDVNSKIENPNWKDPLNGDFSVVPVCGNDKLDENEQCDDGNNINGDGCSSICQSEQDTITLDVQLSRTECTAPCGIYVDASSTSSTQTLEPFYEVDYDWDFGNPTASFENNPNANPNNPKGAIAAHVYENPGDYKITLTVNDGTSKSLRQFNIKVNNPEVIYDGKTYCLSTTNSFADCPTQDSNFHLTDQALAFDTLFSSNGPRRLLIHRGETIQRCTRNTLRELTGPFLVDTYGSGSKPTIDASQCQPSGSNLIAQPVHFGIKNNAQDFTFANINWIGGYDATDGTGNRGRLFDLTDGTGNNILFFKNDITGFGLTFRFNNQNYVFMADNFITNFQDYGFYGNLLKSAFLGNKIRQVQNALNAPGGRGCRGDATVAVCPPAHSPIRMPAPQGMVISFNELANFAGWSSGSKAHGPALRFIVDGYAGLNIISDNFFEGGFTTVTLDSQQRAGGTLRPKARTIFERNTLLASRNTQTLLAIRPPGKIIRNNLFLKKNDGHQFPDENGEHLGFSAFSTGISLGSSIFSELVNEPIRIYGNTFANLEESRAPLAKFLYVDGDTVYDSRATLRATDIEVYNNLYYAPFIEMNSRPERGYQGFITWARDDIAGLKSDFNLMYAPNLENFANSNILCNGCSSNNYAVPHTFTEWQSIGFDLNSKVLNPKFVDIDNLNFELSQGSPAIESGKTINSVYNDFNRINRPYHSMYDIGAFEYTGNLLPQCSDGIDNDNNGLIDMDDFACANSQGTGQESPTAPKGQIDEFGWTYFSPSSDSWIVFASSSTGDDANDCLTPQTACKTISRAFRVINNAPGGHDTVNRHRQGMPDWLMLKRGDTFPKPLGDEIWNHPGTYKWAKSGRSSSEPAVVTSYGNPNLPRPIVTGGYLHAGNYVAIVGIDIKSSGGGTGIAALNPLYQYLHIEDSVIDSFYDNLHIQSVVDVKMVRNIIIDASATGGRPQGMYAQDVDKLVLIENLFDHNGWKEGINQPTIFNHNVYTKSSTNAVVKGNIFSEGSSFGFTGSPIHDATINNNLFLKNANTMTFGVDSTPNSNLEIKNNVITQGGRNINGAPQSFGIDVSSTNGLTITDNYFIDKTYGGTTFTIQLTKDHTNGLVKNNVVHNWLGGAEPVDSTTSSTNVVLSPNYVNQPDSSYPNPTRTIDTYAQNIGLADGDDFLQKARSQNKFNWNPDYSACEFNNYIREGFGIHSPIDCSTSRVCKFKFSRFKSGDYYDFCNKELNRIRPKFVTNEGIIEFLVDHDFSGVNSPDFDNGVLMQRKRFKIDPNHIGRDMGRARVTMYNVDVTTPKIMKDGVVCSTCTIESYSNGELVFTVESWSEYTIVEGYVAPTTSSGGSSGGGGGSSGGGGSIAKEITFTNEWSNHLFSRFDKPYFTYQNTQYRIFLDSFDDNGMQVTLQSPTQLVTLPLNQYKKVDLDNDGVYDININYKGKDGYKASLDFRLDASTQIVEEPIVEEIVSSPDSIIEKPNVVINLPENLDEIEEKSGRTYKAILIGIPIYAFFLIALVLFRKKIPRVIAHWYYAFHHPKHHNNVMTAYINSMRTHGHSDAMIKEQLLSVGWKSNVIDNLLKK